MFPPSFQSGFRFYLQTCKAWSTKKKASFFHNYSVVVRHAQPPSPAPPHPAQVQSSSTSHVLPILFLTPKHSFPTANQITLSRQNTLEPSKGREFICASHVTKLITFLECAIFVFFCNFSFHCTFEISALSAREIKSASGRLSQLLA